MCIASFNQRDIDSTLQWMTEDVSWPKASEGGSVIGKDEIRAYWTRQWSEFDPHVDPVAISPDEGNRVRVLVHQVVRDLHGGLLFDGEVLHVYTFRDGRIAAMELGGAEDNGSATAAFVHRA